MNRLGLPEIIDSVSHDGKQQVLDHVGEREELAIPDDAEQLRLEEEGDEAGAFSMAGCAVGTLLEWWLSENESERL